MKPYVCLFWKPNRFLLEWGAWSRRCSSLVPLPFLLCRNWSANAVQPVTRWALFWLKRRGNVPPILTLTLVLPRRDGKAICYMQKWNVYDYELINVLDVSIPGVSHMCCDFGERSYRAFFRLSKGRQYFPLQNINFDYIGRCISE